MAQKLSQRAVLEFEICMRQVGPQAASPTCALDSVTRTAGLIAVLQSTFTGKELASHLDISRQRQFGVALVRWFDIRAAYRDIVKNVIDLFFREIRPVRHALLFELGEQGNSGS